MSGVPLETCWDFNKLWNNKFYYKSASWWYFCWIIHDEWIHEYQIYKRQTGHRYTYTLIRTPKGICTKGTQLSGLTGLCIIYTKFFTLLQYINQMLQTQFELLMLSGVPLETYWDFNKLWNNKLYYKAASCWVFLLKALSITHREMEMHINWWQDFTGRLRRRWGGKYPNVSHKYTSSE